jgi:hypothetical protein
MVEAEGADMREAAVEAAITAAVGGAVFIAVAVGARAGLMVAIAAARDRVTPACPEGALGKEDRAEWPGHPERAAGWMDAAA